ncbi:MULTISPECIES: hypothetical protein [unclassified Hyphomicrobium]|uniref:hypothetical protein n=1 Tax=unclassified Hyphomicrobium TaxID=2619925 RepID=UPI000213D66B|nr:MULTISPECIES: hypothetical protein [unclassified Hyphomicrobium]CCB67510.1 conserved protein of unknown function [Hyphomicrobium sp. MC1]
MGTLIANDKAGSSQFPAGGAARTNNQARGDRRNAPQHQPPMHDADAARAVVFAVLNRIEGYVEEETVALDKAPNFDLKTSNDRKSQGLVDLNHAMRRLKSDDINEDLELRLQVFRGKLAVNLRKIRLHLDAVKEITAMLSDAIQNAESDGTYTRNIGPMRSSP